MRHGVFIRYKYIRRVQEKLANGRLDNVLDKDGGTDKLRNRPLHR